MKERDPIRGSLVGRDVHETVVSVKGRQVKIPNHLVKEVRRIIKFERFNIRTYASPNVHRVPSSTKHH